MKFTGICLITRNVPTLADFYVRVLNAHSQGDETHVDLQVEGAGITIFSYEGMEGMAPHSMNGAGCGSITIGIEVEDVDVEYERLITLGVDILKPPATYPWGARSIWFRDPDRNIVDFYQIINR
jgi:uncharacterized glyoxalase superfamily protein PhnB